MPRCLVIFITAATLSAVLSGAVVATDVSEHPSNTEVSSGKSGPASDSPGATPIEPDTTVVQPRPHAWDSILVSGDGLHLSIHFWMGIEECNGLHSVRVSPTDTGIDVQLETGVPAGSEDMACIEIAQLYVTSVTLAEPLITNAE
jgi:hypothetical protein